jgi:hypothetical protein
MLTQLLANSDSFRRQIIEQASPLHQKLLQAVDYGRFEKSRWTGSTRAAPQRS